MDQDEKLIEDIKKLLGDDPTDEDPYEKGFADKLYEDEDNQPEDYGEKSQPAIHAYNADYRQPAPRQRAYEPRSREEATQRYSPVKENAPEQRHAVPSKKPRAERQERLEEPAAEEKEKAR